MKNTDSFLPFYQGHTKVKKRILGLWFGTLGTVTKLKNSTLTWNHVFTQIGDYTSGLPFYKKNID